MRAWLEARLDDRDLWWVVGGLALAILVTRFTVAHPYLAALAVAGAFIVLAPLPALLVLAILLANGAGASLPVGDGLLLAGAAVAGTMALVRSLIRPDWRGPQVLTLLVLGTILARAILAGGFAPGATWTDVLHIAAPYMLILVAVVHLSEEQLERVVQWVVAYGVVLCVLFTVSAFTGAHLAPGTYRVESFHLLGMGVNRVWAPGGLLFPFTYFFCMSRIAIRARGRYVLGAMLAGVAMLLTLSRIVVISLFAGTLAVGLIALFIRGRRRLAVRLAIVAGLAMTGLGLVVNGRFDLVARSSGTTVGSFAVRATLYDQVGSILARNGGQSLGFAPGPYDFSDASIATLIIRFGPIAVVLAGLLLWLALITRSGALARSTREDAAAVILVVPFMVFTTVAAVFTDSLISGGGLALMGLALNGFLFRLAAVRKASRDQSSRAKVTFHPSRATTA
jgi:hypothetical protein